MELAEPFPPTDRPLVVAWSQDTLTPVFVAAFSLRVGVDSHANRAQVLAQIVDPRTDELLGMWSIHSMDVGFIPSVCAEALEEMIAWIGRNM